MRLRPPSSENHEQYPAATQDDPHSPLMNYMLQLSHQYADDQEEEDDDAQNEYDDMILHTNYERGNHQNLNHDDDDGDDDDDDDDQHQIEQNPPEEEDHDDDEDDDDEEDDEDRDDDDDDEDDDISPFSHNFLRAFASNQLNVGSLSTRGSPSARHRGRRQSADRTLSRLLSEYYSPNFTSTSSHFNASSRSNEDEPHGDDAATEPLLPSQHQDMSPHQFSSRAFSSSSPHLPPSRARPHSSRAAHDDSALLSPSRTSLSHRHNASLSASGVSNAILQGSTNSTQQSSHRQHYHESTSHAAFTKILTKNLPHIFSNRKFMLSQKLKQQHAYAKLISQLGGKVYDSIVEHVDLAIFEWHDLEDPQWKLAQHMGIPQLTPQWIEACIQAQKLIRPHKCCIHWPVLRSPSGIAAMHHLVISVTGFVGEERSDLKYLIRACGAKYSGALSKRENTHLICCQPFGEKYRKALEWNICVINKRWLYDCIKSWTCLPEEAYRDVGVLR
eukprot:CAMPEP_0117447370 /NCGR_PEP_ID=MMETSP0759-20121206/6840_1 /TAXON_ID=63605 /ORGANISM="Percolomonas cosmopolitus, Strain WS" /LENGTH=500 /DNA_ID=CAMNT_0005239703 /DNA_START=168 /DNA_END=1670 /DNA_ORIENTATION=-